RRSSDPPAAPLPGPLAPPRPGLPPAGCRELVARLRRRTPPFGGPRRPSYWTHIPRESPPELSCRGTRGQGCLVLGGGDHGGDRLARVVGDSVTSREGWLVEQGGGPL